MCSVEGCGKPHKAHGFCDRHYRRPRHPLADALPARAEAFWGRVDRSGDCCRERLAEGETQASIAHTFGISAISVSRIAHRKTWKSVA